MIPNKNIIKLTSQYGLDPLYFIDGKKITKEDFGALDENSIESINILKDEAAKKKCREAFQIGVVEVISKIKF